MNDLTEYEGRILNVSVDDIVKKLEDLGAKKVADLFFKRYVFDTIPPAKGRWIRLRTDGQKTTLTIKHITNDEIDGTLEWEVTVSDFEAAYQILSQAGIKHRSYQENRRILYKLDGAEIAIDSWPKIPPYIEIEAASKLKVETIAKKLGYDQSELVGINNEKIYLRYGVDISNTKDLTF